MHLLTFFGVCVCVRGGGGVGGGISLQKKERENGVTLIKVWEEGGVVSVYWIQSIKKTVLFFRASLGLP